MMHDTMHIFFMISLGGVFVCIVDMASWDDGAIDPLVSVSHQWIGLQKKLTHQDMC
jgi:hypothetical protein